MNYLFKNEVIDYKFINNQKNKTILFLHGWGGNRFSFQQTINLLKHQFNILTVTMPTIEPTTSVWNLFDYVALIENILSIHSIKSVNIICHSFGFRVAMLLNKKIHIARIVVTAGAGLKKNLNFFRKIIKNNSKILIKSKKFKHFYKIIASRDYVQLCPTNKKTFQNIVNLELKFASIFQCPMLLFWGTKDKDTPIWIAKHLKKHNNTIFIATKSDHFTYIHDSLKFNHEVLNFLKNT